MKIEKKNLNEALKVLGKVVSQTSPVEVQKSIRFVGDANGVTAMATDGIEVGINKVDCFIFQGHPQRPSYWIYIVGKCSENAKLPKTHSPLEEDITVFTALKLAGAAPDDSENLGEIAARFYRYKNWVVFKMPGEQSPFLFEDADKQAYLEKHIRKRSENK